MTGPRTSDAATPTRREVVARLKGAGKSNRGAAGYSRWINRRAGRQLAAVTYLLGRTPNQVSLLSAAFTFPGIAAIAVFRPTWVLGVIATLVLLVGYAFDSADGQLARLRGGGTPAGEWLDHVLDALKITSFHLVIAICWWRFYNVDRRVLLVPLGFTVVATVFFFAIILADLLRRTRRVPVPSGNEPAPVLRSVIVLPNDYGVLCLALLFIGEHAVFIGIYSFLLAANTVFLVVGCARWFRELSRLPPEHRPPD